VSRVAVVTGGGSGLGQSICTKLAHDGYLVAILDLNAEASAKVATEVESLGGRAAAIHVDVSDEASVEFAFQAVREQLGPVSILVTIVGHGARWLGTNSDDLIGSGATGRPGAGSLLGE
jgi:2-hydroxycyclohexanecarboxyl-CoA dehydrogenase